MFKTRDQYLYFKDTFRYHCKLNSNKQNNCEKFNHISPNVDESRLLSAQILTLIWWLKNKTSGNTSHLHKTTSFA